MHGTRQRVAELLQQLMPLTGGLDQLDWAVFPPYPYLSEAEQCLQTSNIALGAQDIAAESEEGAFTGEVSGAMLQDVGVHYVLIGHSERRQYYAETDAVCAVKCLAALKAGLYPVLCVGETLEQRQSEKTFEIIEKQLAAVLSLIDNHAAFAKVTIAYEPVWAIGTGESATAEQAQTVHQFIREQVAQFDTQLSQTIRILYGGSVKPSNAQALLGMPDIDGALVGGASLDAQQFFEIGNVCNKSYS